MTCERRKRVLRDLNKDLLPLAEDQEAFKGAAPLLYGETFERRMKDHLESLKCLRRSMAPKPGTDQFFRKGRSLYPARGGGNFRGRGGGQRYNPYQQRSRPSEDPSKNSDNRICNCNVFMSLPLVHVMPEMQIIILSLYHCQPVEMHGNRTYSYRASKEKPSTSRKGNTQLGKANQWFPVHSLPGTKEGWRDMNTFTGTDSTVTVSC